MYSLTFLKTENQLNKLLRKKNKNNINFLFVSLWDDNSNKLLDALKKKNEWIISSQEDDSEKLYVANSFLTPHSFVIFKSFKLPHLVRIKREKIFSEDYLPRIYHELGL